MRARSVLKRIFSHEFVDKLERDKLFELSASLAYYTALSLAPLLVFTVMSFTFLGASLKEDLILHAQELIGGEAGATIRTVALSADKAPSIRDWAGIIGVLTLLFSAGAIFGQLRRSLNTIFEFSAENSRITENSFFAFSLDFLKQKIFNIAMVIAFVFISLISLMVTSLISFFFKGTAAVFSQLVNLGASLVIFSVLFMAIYLFLPQKRIRTSVAAAAGLFTAFMFSIGKSLIGFYLGHSALASLYGAAGSLIVLLMWVYYSSLIIFISAEIANEVNRAFEKNKKIPVTEF